ncbi:hypothetical protein HK101_003056, partial [Irineochytrium annulatum]
MAAPVFPPTAAGIPPSLAQVYPAAPVAATPPSGDMGSQAQPPFAMTAGGGGGASQMPTDLPQSLKTPLSAGAPVPSAPGAASQLGTTPMSADAIPLSIGAASTASQAQEDGQPGAESRQEPAEAVRTELMPGREVQ